jgi:hypothetical protein
MIRQVPTSRERLFTPPASSRPILMRLLALALALGGCGEATDGPGGGDRLGFILPWPVVDSVSLEATAPPEVREIRTWGLDADSPFGVIIDATLMGDSLIVVADRVGCAIHILDIRAPDAPPRSIGGCGDGPGEFRRVISVAFDGEALLVADAGHGRLHRLDATGQLLDTDRLDLAELSGSVIMSRADGVAGGHTPPGADADAPGTWTARPCGSRVGTGGRAPDAGSRDLAGNHGSYRLSCRWLRRRRLRRGGHGQSLGSRGGPRWEGSGFPRRLSNGQGLGSAEPR